MNDECDMKTGPCACGAWHGNGPVEPLTRTPMPDPTPDIAATLVDELTITVKEAVPQPREYVDRVYTLSELREIWPKGQEEVVSKLLDEIERLRAHIDTLTAERDAHKAKLDSFIESVLSIADIQEDRPAATFDTVATEALLDWVKRAKEAEKTVQDYRLAALCELGMGEPTPTKVRDAIRNLYEAKRGWEYMAKKGLQNLAALASTAKEGTE